MSLAQIAASADLRASLRQRVVRLYRSICRDIPRIIVMYGVEGYSSADARRLVLLNHFRKNAGVTDPRVIELMLDNARMEIEETMQQWKQKPHIMALLEPEVQPVDPWEPEEYQRLFESGKTDLHNAVWAGHDPVAHTKRLAKLAVRIQRESPEDWEEIQRVEGLIAKLEGVELR